MLDFICRNLIQSAFTSQSVECISNTQESSNPNNDREWAGQSYRASEELQQRMPILRTSFVDSPISRCLSAAFLLLQGGSNSGSALKTVRLRQGHLEPSEAGL